MYLHTQRKLGIEALLYVPLYIHDLLIVRYGRSIHKKHRGAVYQLCDISTVVAMLSQYEVMIFMIMKL